MKINQIFGGIITVLIVNCTIAQAQMARPGHVAPKPRLVSNAPSLKDGLTMQKGRVVLTELGITNPLSADKKLINGTTISPTGVVTATDGTASQINEGDHVSLTGRITTRRAIADADSIAKVQLFDAKYPGKRKKMEEAKAQRDKEKAKHEEEKAKMKAKLEKTKMKR